MGKSNEVLALFDSHKIKIGSKSSNDTELAYSGAYVEHAVGAAFAEETGGALSDIDGCPSSLRQFANVLWIYKIEHTISDWVTY